VASLLPVREIPGEHPVRPHPSDGGGRGGGKKI